MRVFNRETAASSCALAVAVLSVFAADAGGKPRRGAPARATSDVVRSVATRPVDAKLKPGRSPRSSIAASAKRACDYTPGGGGAAFVSPSGGPAASFIAPATLRRIFCEGAPADLLWTTFLNHESSVRTWLNQRSPRFAALNRAGVMLVFATVLAYELKAPKAPLASTSTLALAEVLGPSNAGTGITCQIYAAVAAQLYQRMWSYGRRQSPLDPTLMTPARLVPFGTARESAFDNHSTMAAFGTGVPLFVDPTTSIVAPISLFEMLQRKRVPAADVVDFSRRADHLFKTQQPDYATLDPATGSPRNYTPFRQVIREALTGGTLDARALLYAYDYPYDPAGHFTYASTDELGGAQRVTLGGAEEFWFAGPVDGKLWRLNAQGVSPVPVPGGRAVASFVPVAERVYVRTRQGTLHQFDGARWVDNNNAGGIAEIAPGIDHAALFLRTTDGVVWRIDAAGWSKAPLARGIAGLVGTGDALYLLERSSGALRRFDSNAMTSAKTIATGVDRLIPGYGSRRDSSACASSVCCRASSACPGQVVFRRGSGGLYGELFWIAKRGLVPQSIGGRLRETLSPQQVVDYAFSKDVAAVYPSASGLTMNVLTGSGRLWQWDPPPVAPGNVLPFAAPRASYSRFACRADLVVPARLSCPGCASQPTGRPTLQGLAPQCASPPCTRIEGTDSAGGKYDWGAARAVPDAGFSCAP